MLSMICQELVWQTVFNEIIPYPLNLLNSNIVLDSFREYETDLRIEYKTMFL